MNAPCSVPDCTVTSRALGLCNTHYISYWRRTERQLQAELRAARLQHGDPANYYCEATSNCTETPVRWWVKDNEPRAYCQTHATLTLDELRLDIRRLEAK